jgi:hypothetical protein
MLKELCNCGRVAVWDYMSGFSSGCSPYFCDDCVPRGCSCNHRYVEVSSYEPPLVNPDLPVDDDGEEGIDWKWIEEGRIWVRIDEKGREYPCAEYDWDPDGYEREINPHEYETK